MDRRILPTYKNIHEKIEGIKDHKKRSGHKLIYLAGANIAEVFGKYSPTSRDIIEYEDSVLFKIKCARHGGALRPVLLPKLPWVIDVFRHIIETDSPFSLHPNTNTSKRYAQWEAEKIFSDYYWLNIDYAQVFKHEKWTKYFKEITQPKNAAEFNFPTKQTAFTLSSLQKMRERELIVDYDFNRVEYEAFTGWCSFIRDEDLYEIGMIYYDKLLAS